MSVTARLSDTGTLPADEIITRAPTTARTSIEYTWAVRDSQMGTKAKALCWALASRGTPEHAWSATLPADTGLSPRTLARAKAEAIEAGYLVLLSSGRGGNARMVDTFQLTIPARSTCQPVQPICQGGSLQSARVAEQEKLKEKENDDGPDSSPLVSSGPSGQDQDQDQDHGRTFSPQEYAEIMCRRLNEHLDDPLDPGLLPVPARKLLQRMYPDPEDIPAREIGYGHLETFGPTTAVNEAAVLASHLAAASEAWVRAWAERGAQRLAAEDRRRQEAESSQQDAGDEPEDDPGHEDTVSVRIRMAEEIIAKRQAKQQAEDARQAGERRAASEIEAYWPQFEAVEVDREWFDTTLGIWRKNDKLTGQQILGRMPRWLEKETARYDRGVAEAAWNARIPGISPLYKKEIQDTAHNINVALTYSDDDTNDQLIHGPLKFEVFGPNDRRPRCKVLRCLTEDELAALETARGAA